MDAVPGTKRIAFPDLGKRPRLRAIVAAAGKGPRGKFPAAFYQRRSSFEPSDRGSSNALRSLAADLLAPTAKTAGRRLASHRGRQGEAGHAGEDAGAGADAGLVVAGVRS
jgi:hypothetical protein